jgi:hypothetical protein
MKRVLYVGAAVLMMAGCGTDSVSNQNVVARAGTDELSVVRLAEIAASSDAPILPEIVESIAMRWVEYTLLGRRVALGIELTDSATIVAARWREVRALQIDNFSHARNAERYEITPAHVDSAYNAPDVRFLNQVLKRTPPTATSAERDSLRAVITTVRNRLIAGGSWADANQFNDDRRSRGANGSMGLIARGQTVPPFENVAFSLGPGELSDIVETRDGFHLIFRPALQEIRDDFASALARLINQPLDSIYEAELVLQKGVQIVDGAQAAVRYGAGSLHRARGSDRVLAMYDGGEFTLGDLALFLQYLPPQFHQQVQTELDEELVRLIQSFVTRELVWQEAERVGITLTEEQYQRLASAYENALDGILTATGLAADSLDVLADVHGGRDSAVRYQVDRFIAEAVLGMHGRATMFPGLAGFLLETGNWDVSLEGVERTVLEAAMLRAAQSDTTRQGGGR